MVMGCQKPQRAARVSDGTPRYVTNWSRLKVGMSKGQVRKMFGTPTCILRYTEDTASVPRAREFGDDKAALKADFEAIFGEPHVWQYGKFDLEDVSDEAFLVYFDGGGHVTRWRQPLKGSFANATQPIEPPDDSAVVPSGQTPSELWKTPVLQNE